MVHRSNDRTQIQGVTECDNCQVVALINWVECQKQNQLQNDDSKVPFTVGM